MYDVPAFTNLALEWLFTRVYAQMCREIGILGKRLEAYLTLEWLFPFVSAHVRSECGRPGVHFIANAALIFTCAGNAAAERSLCPRSLVPDLSVFSQRQAHVQYVLVLRPSSGVAVDVSGVLR